MPKYSDVVTLFDQQVEQCYGFSATALKYSGKCSKWLDQTTPVSAEWNIYGVDHTLRGAIPRLLSTESSLTEVQICVQKQAKGREGGGY